MMHASLLLLLSCATLVAANQYDVIYPHYIAPAECKLGCAHWADINADGVTANQSTVDALFANHTVPASAMNNCAHPGMMSVHGEGLLVGSGDEWLWDPIAGTENASLPYCLCKGSEGATAGLCTAPLGIPEQINLQYASQDTVVASFVTYETTSQTSAPSAMLNGKLLTGISHFSTAGDEKVARNHTFSFVKFSSLVPATMYTYKVKSGAAGAQWSAEYTFRSIRAAPETRFAMYGDMGVSPYNNMQNLLTDCQAGKIDVFAHMGDHCYDMRTDDDRKGDAYMNAMQPLLTQCPWIPIIGNHESSDAARYVNQTWGEVYANPLNGATSTATSALGHLMTKGTLLAAGLHGTTPSGTSSYFSVDVGLVHIAAMSSNHPSGAELAWLEADLRAANANRASVPWIIVSSHYQIYLSSLTKEYNSSSAAWYDSMAGEFSPDAKDMFRTCSAAGEEEGCRTVGEELARAQAATDQVFLKYGVDIYNAGHAHEYGVTWPMISGNATQKDFVDPGQATVYITEGNGGVPGVAASHHLNKPKADWARIHGTGGAYGRFSLTAQDKGTLSYEHVWNNGNNGTGQVMDTWQIKRTKPHPALPP